MKIFFSYSFWDAALMVFSILAKEIKICDLKQASLA